MPQYLCLIYSNENDETGVSDADRQATIMRYMELNGELKAAGKYVAGDALMPTSTATTVRVRDGKTLTTDGPFAETKEQLGGYYLIEADDLDDAIAWGAKIPASESGSIEVRPIMVIPGDG